MLIRNYGLFWRRTEVDWGAQGRSTKGTLLGTPTKKRRSDPVDFRLQQGVYILYDDTFKIIYVGQAGVGKRKLFSRLRSHKRDHLAERWTRFSWFGLLPVQGGALDEAFEFEQPNVAKVLDHIEAILIAAAEPPLNLQRGRFGDDVERYLQRPIDQAKVEAEEDEDGDE